MNTVTPLRQSSPFVRSPKDEAALHLLRMNFQTDLVALDRTIEAVKDASSRVTSYKREASYCHTVGERMCRAIKEVGSYIHCYSLKEV